MWCPGHSARQHQVHYSWRRSASAEQWRCRVRTIQTIGRICQRRRWWYLRMMGQCHRNCGQTRWRMLRDRQTTSSATLCTGCTRCTGHDRAETPTTLLHCQRSQLSVRTHLRESCCMLTVVTFALLKLDFTAVIRCETSFEGGVKMLTDNTGYRPMLWSYCTTHCIILKFLAWNYALHTVMFSSFRQTSDTKLKNTTVDIIFICNIYKFLVQPLSN